MNVIEELNELRNEVMYALQAHGIANALRHDTKIDGIIEYLEKQEQEAKGTDNK